MQLPDTFSALGDPTRFAIVERLLREGELPAGDISAGVDISAPAVSRHLKTLVDAGILIRRIDKQHRFYAPNPDAIRQINAWVISHREFWEKSLDRLQKALEKGDIDG